MNLQEFLFGGTASNDGFHVLKSGNDGYPTNYSEFKSAVSEIIAMYGYDSNAEMVVEIEHADTKYRVSEEEIERLYSDFENN